MREVTDLASSPYLEICNIPCVQYSVIPGYTNCDMCHAVKFELLN